MLCKMAIVLDQCESNFACMLSARSNTTPLHYNNSLSFSNAFDSV